MNPLYLLALTVGILLTAKVIWPVLQMIWPKRPFQAPKGEDPNDLPADLIKLAETLSKSWLKIVPGNYRLGNLHILLASDLEDKSAFCHKKVLCRIGHYTGRIELSRSELIAIGASTDFVFWSILQLYFLRQTNGNLFKADALAWKYCAGIDKPMKRILEDVLRIYQVYHSSTNELRQHELLRLIKTTSYQ